MKLKFIVDGGAVLLLILLIGGGVWLSLDKNELPQRVQRIQSMQKGDFQFSFQDMKGRTYSLGEFQGKVVLLNIWATWCPPCVEEIPDLIQLARSFPEEFIIIAVSEESVEDIENFFSKFDTLSSNFILSRTSQIQEVFSPQALPESYLLDKQGRLMTKVLGVQSWMDETWRNKIQSAL